MTPLDPYDPSVFVAFALREQIWSNQLLPERHDGSSVMGIQCDLVWPWMLHVVSCAALGPKSASRPAVRGDSLFCDSDLISFARSSEDSQCVRFTMGGGQEGWDITFVSDCEPWRAAGLVSKWTYISPYLLAYALPPTPLYRKL